MVLPRVSASELRRRMLQICQEHARKVLESIRKLPLLLACYLDDDVKGVENYKNEILNAEQEAIELKRTLMSELSMAGSLLSSREDYLHLVAIGSGIIDHAAGIAYRISEMASRKWKVKKEILKDLIMLSEAVLNTISRLRETIYSLSFSVTRTGELAKNVESAEIIVDSIYRKLDLTIMKSDMELASILSLRDIARFLEEIADKAEDAADVARALSLSAI